MIVLLFKAYCDVAQHLPCYDWVVKEANRYGSKWSKRWAQEQAITTITSYLSDILAEHAHAADTALYPQWEDYLRDFLHMGGIIEAVPPSESITPLAVDIFIDPTGQIKVYCTLDQVSHLYTVLNIIRCSCTDMQFKIQSVGRVRATVLCSSS
jgi:hypothetical protein